MTRRRQETVAIAVTLVGLAAAVLWPLGREALATRPVPGSHQRVITLTGVASTGKWTTEPVQAGSYWIRDYPPARPSLEVGETVLLRFKSADVTHTFYAPALGIGPVEVYPGHVAEVAVTPRAAGVFEYYCTTVCGKPHFGMRGVIEVRNGHLPHAVATADYGDYWNVPRPGPEAGVVDHGRWLYRRSGCFTCHGAEGEGGVPNFNYVKDTVPALEALNERLFLFYPEDVELILEAFENGTPLEELSDDPPVPRYAAVLANYESIKNVIRDGNPAGKLDPEGPEPPLQMPPWSPLLSESEIEQIVAYLLSLSLSQGA